MSMFQSETSIDDNESEPQQQQQQPFHGAILLRVANAATVPTKPRPEYQLRVYAKIDEVNKPAVPASDVDYCLLQPFLIDCFLCCFFSSFFVVVVRSILQTPNILFVQSIN